MRLERSYPTTSKARSWGFADTPILVCWIEFFSDGRLNMSGRAEAGGPCLQHGVFDFGAFDTTDNVWPI